MTPKTTIVRRANHDRTGNPKNSARGKPVKAADISCELTHLPSEIKKMIPRKIVMVPRVTTMGGMASFHTKSPLIAPMIAPSRIAIAIIIGIGRPGIATLTIATAIPVSARFAATDRSMQRVRITTICPNARIISGAVSLNTLARLDGVTKPANREEIRIRSNRIAPANTPSRTGINRLMLRPLWLRP